MSKQKETLTPNRTYLCQSVEVGHRPQAVKRPKPVAAPIKEKQKKANPVDYIEQFSLFFDSLYQNLKKVVDKRFVIMKNKDVWFDRDVAGLYPRMDKHDMPVYQCRGRTELQKFYRYHQDNYVFAMMSSKECNKTFCKHNGNPFLDSKGYLKYRGMATYNNYIITENYIIDGITRQKCCCWQYTFGKSNIIDGCNGRQCYSTANLIPIYRLKGKDASPMSFNDGLLAWWKEKLVPEGLSSDLERRYIKIMGCAQILPYIHAQGKILKFDDTAYKRDRKSEADLQAILGSVTVVPTPPPKPAAPPKPVVSPLDLVKLGLLQCDWLRANISPYGEKRLTDINMGHWELYEQMAHAQSGSEMMDLPKDEPWVARPPQLDVRLNAVCSIDFGTKSTVVVRRDGDERLLRIGKGDYTKAVTPTDYENPTVVELRDLTSFQKAYAQRQGRPYTEWEQMTVSHQAAEAIFQSEDDSSIFYSVFSELKQWANDPQRRLILKDRKGQMVELKPYLELGDDDFDPIEAYAYYLGLYINNMHNGICLDYILSFPVNYAKDVRERIRLSFERGLRKSLPPALLEDDGVMKRFRVYGGASEPAAYAVCALREYGLEPTEVGQVVSYGVFDFGGGTTDFDFGMEQIPQNHKRKFVVEQFGSGGDVYLGGEHILDLLAYEVYLDNMAVMRSKNIPFVLPPQGHMPAGAETLVFERHSASQQAFMNCKRIAKELRPLWERQGGYEKKYDRGDTAVRLFSSVVQPKGDYSVEVPLKIDIDRLESRIEGRIREGVENFFTALKQAFKDKQPYPIHIFLAGNSCKSPVVQKLFEEYIGKIEAELAASILKNQGKEKEAKGSFVLHLPLGMTGEKSRNAAEEKQTKLYEDVLQEKQAKTTAAASEPSPEESLAYNHMLTGKTGVAFGLLRCRKGGKDVKIVNHNTSDDGEVLFPYYLGIEGENGCFQVVIDKEVSYQKWMKFIPAESEEPEFELYYTTEPQAMESTLSLSDVGEVRCFYDADQITEDNEDDVNVYIRKVSPTAIEYTVATEAGIQKEEYLADAVRCELQK